MSILEIQRDFDFRLGERNFTGKFLLPMENAAIGVALSRRLGGIPFTALPEKTILYEKACLTLNSVLDTAPEILASCKIKEETIEIKHKGQVYKAKLLSPALSTEIDLETARQLEFVSLSSLSQEAYAVALIAVTLNVILEDNKINWLENPDTQTALELYRKCVKESKKALPKIKTDKASQGVKNDIDWHDLPDPEYVLQVYGAYQQKYESFQEELKKNNNMPKRQVSKQSEPARPVSNQETPPQPNTDQQAVSTAKTSPVQARLVRRA